MSSQPSWCRLCLNICDSYENIYDENGDCNVELYEIIVKYIDATFLTMTEGNHLMVICLECWDHISEFHNFYSVILSAQAQLRELHKQNSPAEGNSVDAANRNEASHVHNEAELIAQPELELPSDGHSVDQISQIVISGGPNQVEFIALPKLEIMDNNGYSSDTERTCAREDETQVNNVSNTGDVPHNKDPSEVMSGDDTSQSGSSYQGSESLADPVVGVLTGTELNKTKQLNLIKNARKSIKRKNAKQIDDIIGKLRPHLECVICKKSHPTYSAAFAHFRQEHPKEKQFYTLCCGRKMSKPAHIMDHGILHLDPNSFKCQLCGKCCTSKYTLYNHKYIVHSITSGGKKSGNQKTCSMCGKSFKHIIDFEEHMASHTGTDLYKCMHCEQKFKCRFAIYYHCKASHPQEWVNRKNVKTPYFTKI